ncbi:benzoate/H(+) symporter BenE family transporter [Streptomyces sp. NPDC058657]|uniref:benzoate/H(+) symporter BenE family transporter n=1 Tax=unclassified Streptomyces TaxID=2593676 RepID=UPI00365727A3
MTTRTRATRPRPARTRSDPPRGTLQPVLAGIVLMVVGFSSSFAVVLAGLRAVGANEAQAASGLLVLCVSMGVVGIWLGLRYRLPMSVAWSTPGAALLAAVGTQHPDYRAALGAFLVTGALIFLTGLSPHLVRLLQAIPAPLASAMLAGVLLPLCLAPVRAVVEFPAEALPVVAVWAVLLRWARRWAVPAALAVTVAVILLAHPGEGNGAPLLPVLTFATPAFTVGALIGIAIPLYVVTMVSQNVAGMSMLATYGYRAPLRPALTSTGLATMAGAPFGAHAVNLAAITTALAAGPDAHPDPDRRWIASVTGAAGYLVLALTTGLTLSLIAGAPPLLIETVAGLALLSTLAAALQTAVSDTTAREPAVLTLVVTASGIAPFGIGAALWGLLAGLALHLLLTRAPTLVRKTPAPTASAPTPTAPAPATPTPATPAPTAPTPAMSASTPTTPTPTTPTPATPASTAPTPAMSASAPTTPTSDTPAPVTSTPTAPATPAPAPVTPATPPAPKPATPAPTSARPTEATPAPPAPARHSGDVPATPPGDRSVPPPGDHPSSPPGDHPASPPRDHPATPPHDHSVPPPRDDSAPQVTDASGRRAPAS